MKWKFLIYVDDTDLEEIPKEIRPGVGDKYGFVGTNDRELALRLATYSAYRVVNVEECAELSREDNAEGHRVQWAINEIEFKS